MSIKHFGFFSGGLAFLSDVPQPLVYPDVPSLTQMELERQAVTERKARRTKQSSVAEELGFEELVARSNAVKNRRKALKGVLSYLTCIPSIVKEMESAGALVILPKPFSSIWSYKDQVLLGVASESLKVFRGSISDNLVQALADGGSVDPVDFGFALKTVIRPPEKVENNDFRLVYLCYYMRSRVSVVSSVSYTSVCHPEAVSDTLLWVFRNWKKFAPSIESRRAQYKQELDETSRRLESFKPVKLPPPPKKKNGTQEERAANRELRIAHHNQYAEQLRAHNHRTRCVLGQIHSRYADVSDDLGWRRGEEERISKFMRDLKKQFDSD